MNGFDGLLKAEYSPPKSWTLSRALSFRAESLSLEEIDVLRKVDVDCSSRGEIRVESGFTTDLASVPRSLWIFLSPWDIARAGVVHDKLYSKCLKYFHSENCNYEIWENARKAADNVFFYAMEASDPAVPLWKIKSAYYSVRIFGKNHAR